MIYYGQEQCEAIVKSTGKNCTNKAYYVSNNMLTCGVHSKKNSRTELPKNPDEKQYKKDIQSNRDKLVVETAENNMRKGIIGSVICSKLKMMKEPDHVDGYLKIFPNFKHGNRTDGIGLPSLSPKSLGPILHGMIFPDGKKVPIAKNLENFHQFAKFFDGETEESFRELRSIGYEDSTPYRHKFEHPKFTGNSPTGNKNIPRHSIYYDKEGKERIYSYIECRYFYCHYYEKLVENLKEYKELHKLRKEGYNLQIIGYDGKHVDDSSEKGLYKLYLDSSSPFGHELVLFSMLVLEKNQYPWRNYYQRNYKIYENVI